MNIYVAVIVGYAIALVGFGLWVGRRVRRVGDFFVAGRQLGPGLLFATVLAANIGAGSTVSAAGLGYRNGLSAWWWVGSAAIGTLLLAVWVGPRIRRIAAERGLYTVGDLIEYRYGPAARAAMAALLWIGTLAILAGQLIALAWVLEVVAGIPKAASASLGGVVMVTYFAAGGLVGAAWINMVQLVVLFGGLVVALPLVLAKVGGVAGLATGATTPDYLRFWDSGGTSLRWLALLVPPFIVSPGLLQKVYGARDDKAVRVGLGVCALVMGAFAFVPPLFGMAASALAPGLENPELALPLLLRDHLPVAVGAIGLGALFMAEVSSADAILFMLATSLSQDLYKRFIDPDATDAMVLRVARGAAVVGGLAGVVLTIFAESIVGVLSVFYSLVGAMLFVPVVAAVYTGRAGPPEAFAAFGGGVLVAFSVDLITDGVGYGIFNPYLLGLVASALGFGVVALVRWRHPSIAIGPAGR